MIPLLLLAAAAVPAAPPTPPTVREEVRVHAVRIPVLALDPQDRPVGDLRPGEIVVQSGGRTIDVAWLERLAPEPGSPGGPSGARLSLDAPGGWAEEATSPGGEPRYLAVLVDVEHDDLLRRDEARASVQAALRASLGPAVRAAVFSWDGSLRQEIPFTTDRAALASALATAWSRTAPAAGDPRTRMRELMEGMRDCASERMPGRCLRETATLYADEVRPRAQAFVEGLGGVVRLLAGVDGAKTILLIGHGLPIDPEPALLEAARAVLGPDAPLGELQTSAGFGEGARSEMAAVLEAAVRARVVLHVVDRTAAPDDRGAARGTMLAPGASPLRAAWAAAQRDLGEAAGATGGLFAASDDPGPPAAVALASDRGSYELGVVLPDDGTAVSEKVRLRSSRAGVRLLHGRGVRGPDPVAQASLAGRIVVEPGGPGVSRRFAIEADPRPLGYRVEGDQAVADYTVHLVLRDATGRAVADAHHFLNHAYPADLWTSGRAGPVVLRGRLSVPGGGHTLTATFRALRGDAGGRLSVTVP